MKQSNVIGQTGHHRKSTLFTHFLRHIGSIFDMPMLSVLGLDLKDPFLCKTKEEMSRVTEENIEKLKRKIDAICRLSQRKKEEWQSFVQEKSHFTPEQWEKFQEMNRILEDPYSHMGSHGEPREENLLLQQESSVIEKKEEESAEMLPKREKGRLMRKKNWIREK